MNVSPIHVASTGKTYCSVIAIRRGGQAEFYGIKIGDLLYHPPDPINPGCKALNAEQTVEDVLANVNNNFKSVSVAELVELSKSTVRPVSFVVERLVETDTAGDTDERVKCSISQGAVDKALNGRGFPKIPYCRKCSNPSLSVQNHHYLCSKHQDFHNAGSKEKLIILLSGVRDGCEACIYEVENGRKKSSLGHNLKCEMSSKKSSSKTASKATSKAASKVASKVASKATIEAPSRKSSVSGTRSSNAKNKASGKTSNSAASKKVGQQKRASATSDISKQGSPKKRKGAKASSEDTGEPSNLNTNSSSTSKKVGQQKRASATSDISKQGSPKKRKGAKASTCSEDTGEPSNLNTNASSTLKIASAKEGAATESRGGNIQHNRTAASTPKIADAKKVQEIEKRGGNIQHSSVQVTPAPTDPVPEQTSREACHTPLLLTDDISVPKWVPCTNPWGDRAHCDGDFTLFSTADYTSAFEVYGSNPKRFVMSPFDTESSLYHKTHFSQEEGGFRVLQLTRDRLALRSWGFRFCCHDFGGACLVTEVEPMSPADSAVRIKGLMHFIFLLFRSVHLSRSALSFYQVFIGSGKQETSLQPNDMIICVNNKNGKKILILAIPGYDRLDTDWPLLKQLVE